MKPKGVNRVVLAVKDLDKAIELYSNLLGATFSRDSFVGEAFGFDVANSWDAGIELCAPLPGKDSIVSQSIEQNGEGVMAVIFEVDDVEEARDRADKLGISLLIPIEYSDEQLRDNLQDRFTKYKEYVMNSAEACGYSLILGQFDPK